MKKYGVMILALLSVLFILAGCTRNEMPVIDVFEITPASDTLIIAGDTVEINIETSDPEGDSIIVTVDVDGGSLQGSLDGSELFWIAPDYSGTFNLTLTVTDRDTVYDTSDYVSETIQVHVQNFFPMNIGQWRYYEGFIYFLVNVPKSLKRTVYSREDLADGEVRWHIETRDSTETQLFVDSLDYFSVKNGTVFESERIYSRLDVHLFEGDLCDLPLWEGKIWNYRDSTTVEVVEIRSRGTDAFSFEGCAHLRIVNQDDSLNVRTVWLAPDVGIIEDKAESEGSTIYEFELSDFSFE